ncbi:MAG: hypothetical protein JW765_05280 [Deltaproteobacteria bacterium]|nr:hypothetical protein [Candidatus Zymogenaceae bacterium]
MQHYYVSKLEMILGGQLKETESENYKSTNDIDILESLLRQNPENLKQTIDLLYAQIEEREKLKHKTLYELQDQIMKVQCLISHASGGYEKSPFTKSSLDKAWIDLEKEKLKEEINSFKDVSYLNTRLVYMIGKYKEEKGKHDLIQKK